MTCCAPRMRLASQSSAIERWYTEESGAALRSPRLRALCPGVPDEESLPDGGLM